MQLFLISDISPGSNIRPQIVIFQRNATNFATAIKKTDNRPKMRAYQKPIMEGASKAENGGRTKSREWRAFQKQRMTS